MLYDDLKNLLEHVKRGALRAEGNGITSVERATRLYESVADLFLYTFGYHIQRFTQLKWKHVFNILQNHHNKFHGEEDEEGQEGEHQ